MEVGGTVAVAVEVEKGTHRVDIDFPLSGYCFAVLRRFLGLTVNRNANAIFIRFLCFSIIGCGCGRDFLAV